MGFTVKKGSEKGFLRRGVSRRCLERPLVEYAPLGVHPISFDSLSERSPLCDAPLSSIPYDLLFACREDIIRCGARIAAAIALRCGRHMGEVMLTLAQTNKPLRSSGQPFTGVSACLQFPSAVVLKNLNPFISATDPPLFLGLDTCRDLGEGSVLSRFSVGVWSVLVIFDRN